MAKGRSGPDMSSLLVSGVIVPLTHFHLSGLLRSLPELCTLWDGLSHVSNCLTNAVLGSRYYSGIVRLILYLYLL